MSDAPRRYVQRSRAAAAAATGERIVAFARALFFSSGDAPTIEAVAARAGVTAQTVFRRFGSKEGLFDACVAAGRAEVAGHRFRVAPGDVDGAVDNLLDHYDAWAERSLSLQRLATSSPAAAAALEAARALHVEWVETVFAPWLAREPPRARRRLRALLVMLTDVHAWRVLCREQRLGRADARAALHLAITATLSAHPPASSRRAKRSP